MLLYNDPVLKERRKELRTNQTEAENQLWKYLKGKQFDDLKFFRQYSVGPYILDFYCPSKRLAIKVDGGGHAEKDVKVYDDQRTIFLEGNGIHVVRFWNDEVMKNTEGVFQRIQEVVKEMG